MGHRALGMGHGALALGSFRSFRSFRSRELSSKFPLAPRPLPLCLFLPGPHVPLSPMPHARCPMPNAPCPIPNSQFL
ncbi:MAG: hypothetical protein F6J93_12435 [Oscillatoria sp. SIO1A7]|nr:hypothetical protein [Oscillatoria sp. SIO1A7]